MWHVHRRMGAYYAYKYVYNSLSFMWLIARKSMRFEIVFLASEGMGWLTPPNLLIIVQTEPVIHISSFFPHIWSLDNWINLKQRKSGFLYLHSLHGWRDWLFRQNVYFYMCHYYIWFLKKQAKKVYFKINKIAVNNWTP